MIQGCRPNRTYVLILAISMLLVISFVYIGSSNQNKTSNEADSIYQLMAGLVPANILPEDGCEQDNFVNMEEYLKNRKMCILRYCGDVCKTDQVDLRKFFRYFFLLYFK